MVLLVVLWDYFYGAPSRLVGGIMGGLATMITLTVYAYEYEWTTKISNCIINYIFPIKNKKDEKKP